MRKCGLRLEALPSDLETPCKSRMNWKTTRREERGLVKEVAMVLGGIRRRGDVGVSDLIGFGQSDYQLQAIVCA